MDKDKDILEDDVVVERQDELPPEGDEADSETTVEVEAEPIEEEEEEEKPKKPKRPGNTAKERISGLVHRVHQYEDRLREMQEQQELMQQELAQAHQAATRHFDDSVSLQLDKAKQLKRQALESGDVDAITDADVAIASAASAMQQAQILKHQQKRYEEDYQTAPNYQEQEQTPNEYRKELQRFASQNTWYYPDSPDYDEALSSRLKVEVDNFERRLHSTGRGHLIGSRPYFQEINRYIASEMLDDEPQPQRREVRMKPQGYTNTAPGRTAGRLPLQKETRKLTTDERMMGRRAGAKSDEDILKAILEDERETGRRRR